MVDYEIHLRWWLDSEDHHASTLSSAITWLLDDRARLISERDAACAETHRVVTAHSVHVTAIRGASEGLRDACGYGSQGRPYRHNPICVQLRRLAEAIDRGPKGS